MRNSIKILLAAFLMIMIAGCLEKGEKTPEQPINLVRMGGQDMVQRLGTGEIAGFIMWEPYPS